MSVTDELNQIGRKANVCYYRIEIFQHLRLYFL